MKALIFDLDGTLLDTLGDLHSCVNFALKKFGFLERSLEEVRKFVGNGLKSLVRRSLPDGAEEETVEEVLTALKAHYISHAYDKTIPYDGIMPFLEECQKSGYSMAIVSNKADPMVQLLRQVYFDDLIPVAVGETEEIARKPAPDMVNTALERLGVGRGDAVYIGDSEVDILTAHNAQLPCLSVSWGFRSESELLAAGATSVSHTPEELFRNLQQILG